MQIEIYPIEQADGIASLVAKGSIAFAASIIEPRIKLDANDLLDKLLTSRASANPNQRDLFVKNSILASIGWNDNDDVFEKEPTWNARHSVRDKQLNLNHNENDIIGHMTDSYVFDAAGNIIPDNTPFDQVPDTFDIASEFVIYKMWEGAERLEQVSKILNEIEDGLWFVSMECRFPRFDYAIIDTDGTHKTIARNEKTAFLSKYLRVYDGVGEYQGRKIGRIPRDLFFTGQGIVKNPANKRSIIFSSAIKPFKSQGSLVIRDTKMDEKQVAELQAKLTAALVEVETLKAEKNGKKHEDEMSSVKCQLQAAVEAKTVVEAALASAKASITEKDTAITTLTSELSTAKEQVTVARTEMDSMKAEANKAARASKLVAAGVAQDSVNDVVAKWESLNDTQFDEIVAMYKKDKKEEKKEEKTEASVVETPVITESKVEPSANLNTAPVENSRGKALASLLSEGLQFSSKASARKNQK